MTDPTIRIGDRLVGGDHPAYFIADIGANHDGSLERAQDLVRLAAEAGADAVKFQHFTADQIVSERGFRDLGGALSHQRSWGKPVHEVYADASLPREWTLALWETARDAQVDFMSTPYDLEAVKLLDPLVPAFKVGSGDIDWLELLEILADTGKPVLLATGASTMQEVSRAVEVLSDAPLAVLQCNTNYTGDSANVDYLNLRALDAFRRDIPSAVLGLSDHTKSVGAVVGAIALGARIVERHFTDSSQRVGPDHGFALEPEEWSEMVAAVRDFERARGTGEKDIMANEREARVVQRRSVRVRRDMTTGDLITRDDIEVLRPAPPGSISPSFLDAVVGNRLVRDVTHGEHLVFEDLAPTS